MKLVRKPSLTPQSCRPSLESRNREDDLENHGVARPWRQSGMVASPQTSQIYRRPPISEEVCPSKPEMIQRLLRALRDAKRSRLFEPRATCHLVLCPLRQAKAPCFPKPEQTDRSQAKRERVSSMFRNTNNGNWCSIDCCTGSGKPSASLAQNPTKTSICLAYPD